ncbi:MAG: hypothetical protein MRY63_06560 [Neomegalonema sp.]|nr:hypothetical protein [Neomegalonema sp.]
MRIFLLGIIGAMLLFAVQGCAGKPVNPNDPNSKSVGYYRADCRSILRRAGIEAQTYRLHCDDLRQAQLMNGLYPAVEASRDPAKSCVIARQSRGESKEVAEGICGRFSDVCRGRYVFDSAHFNYGVTQGKGPRRGTQFDMTGGDAFFYCLDRKKKTWTVETFGNLTTYAFGTDFGDFITREMKGSTVFFRDPCHGWQIEYYGSDGRSFLWYGKNKKVVTGRWSVRGPEQRYLNTHDLNLIYEFCQTTDAPAYNPVAKQVHAGEHCLRVGHVLDHAVKKINGDIYGLSKGGEVPHSLSERLPEATPVDIDSTHGMSCAQVLKNRSYLRGLFR